MWLYDLFVFALGLALGSFLNVCIHRWPRGESVVHPPSQCPTCHRRVRPWENIPLISFFLLSRRCAGCKSTIAWRYPLVEALTGVVLVVLFRVYGFGWDTIRYSVLYLLLIPITFIDLDHRLILNRMTYPGMIVGLALSIVAMPDQFWRPMLGLLAGGGFLYGVGLLGQMIFKQESLGGGDIKLGAMAGAFMDARAILSTLFLAFLLASAVAIIGVLSGRLGRRSTIPFGPFIALATAAFVMFGERLSHIYRLLLGF